MHIFLFLFLGTALIAQEEGTRPLSTNLSYFYPSLRQKAIGPNTSVSALRTTTVPGSIQLPFEDDFSYAYKSQYPDQNRWEGFSTYVNWGFPIAPLSFGVATFDGLNLHGYPHNPTLVSNTATFPCDTLTSKPINLYTSGAQTLTPNSGVALSFYYQARGNGDPPEQNDSLILDFFRPLAVSTSTSIPDTSWKKVVWYAEGSSSSNTSDSVFKRAFVRVTDTSMLHEGFRFRFRSSGSVTGDFDHWHLDYVFLNKGRQDSLFDTVRNDLCFAGLPTQFLKEYSEMPLQQYDKSEMAAKFSNRIRSNYGVQINHAYSYRIFDQFGNALSNTYNGNPTNLNPFWPNHYSPPGHGYSVYPPHANPPIIDSFDVHGPNSVYFPIKHYLFTAGSTATDEIRENDTVIQYQYFRNFYAFDDGTAEAGYYINKALAKIAVKTRVNKTDSLLGLRIYFDPVGNVSAISNTATSVYNFTLNVWGADANGNPQSTPLFKDSVTLHPNYFNSLYKEVPEYFFRYPHILGPGTYYIGVQQSSSILTFGYDRNYNHNTSLYYDAGSGWQQSTEHGSIMMQPMFRSYLPPLGVNELQLEKSNFIVYPNPASDQFSIFSSQSTPASYELYNMLGQLVKHSPTESQNQVVTTETLEPGLYLLILKTKGKAVQQQKIIVQH